MRPDFLRGCIAICNSFGESSRHFQEGTQPRATEVRMVPHVRENTTPLRPWNTSSRPGNGVLQPNRPVAACALGSPQLAVQRNPRTSRWRASLTAITRRSEGRRRARSRSVVGAVAVSVAEVAAHPVGVGAAGDDHRFTDVGTVATGKGTAAYDRRKR